MTATTTTSRREATKRQIMGVLNDNHAVPSSSSTALTSKSTSTGKPPEIDGSNPEHVRLLIADIQQQLLHQRELLATETQNGKEEQHNAYSSTMMKLTKHVKKMTIRDFNQAYGCDLVQVMSQAVVSVAAVVPNVAGKKRIRQDLETPAPSAKATRGRAAMTPSRTVRRGERMFSKNGSPVDPVDEGTLVATVSKKRRGKSSIVVDINVGEGRYINLADPGNVQHLDSSMKTEAKSQLLAMQEQMAALMAQLNT